MSNIFNIYNGPVYNNVYNGPGYSPEVPHSSTPLTILNEADMEAVQTLSMMKPYHAFREFFAQQEAQHSNSEASESSSAYAPAKKSRVRKKPYEITTKAKEYTIINQLTFSILFPIKTQVQMNQSLYTIESGLEDGMVALAPVILKKIGDKPEYFPVEKIQPILKNRTQVLMQDPDNPLDSALAVLTSVARGNVTGNWVEFGQAYVKPKRLQERGALFRYINVSKQQLAKLNGEKASYTLTDGRQTEGTVYRILAEK